ncbi:MAG: DUF4199 domain-containing protein [Saprospiraceae bacterium]
MRTETKWAVIASIILFIWLFIEKILGLQTPDKMSTWAIVDIIGSLLIFIAVYFMVTREKREHDLRGVMDWQQGFWAAAIMTLIFIPISTLLLYIFIQAVNPDFASNVFEFISKGSIERDPIDAFLFSHVRIAVIAGLIFSAIFAFINKRATAA